MLEIIATHPITYILVTLVIIGLLWLEVDKKP